MNQRVDTTNQPGTRSRNVTQTEKTGAKVKAASPAKKAPTAAKKSAITKTVATAAPAATISAEQRLRMIAETAYFYAENRGFSAGNDVEDWLAAEREINSKYPE